jgi:DNA-binding NtrC family response regulator
MVRQGAQAVAAAVRHVETGARAPNDGPAAPRRQRHALVVDDERAIMTVMCRVVESMGWSSDGYDDPAEAIGSLTRASTAYDIVLTDMRLGEQTGLDVAATAVRAKPGIPIILLSGAPLSAAMWDTAADVGVQMVIYKPFHLHELVGAIRHLTEPVGGSADGTRSRPAVIAGAHAD